MTWEDPKARRKQKPGIPKRQLPRPRELDMSNILWAPERVQYVVIKFDAGVPPARILAQLRSTGYTDLRLFNIEQCLRTNGRLAHGYNRSSFISNTYFRRNQVRHWDTAADRYTITFHRQGCTVMEIWQGLTRGGYVINAAQVAASLNAQEVSGMRVREYFRRWSSPECVTGLAGFALRWSRLPHISLQACRLRFVAWYDFDRKY